MTQYCQKGKEFLQELKRSDWLPPFNGDSILQIIQEISEVNDIIALIPSESDPNCLNAILYFSACNRRNRIYLNSYILHRMKKLSRLRWETGAILPDKIQTDIISSTENDYFVGYSSNLSDYLQSVQLDLTSDLEPPKELFVQVRVLQSAGEVMTDSGSVKFDKGTTYFLKRSTVGCRIFYPTRDCGRNSRVTCTFSSVEMTKSMTGEKWGTNG